MRVRGILSCAILALVVLPSGACASAGSPSSGGARIEPPKIMAGERAPELSISGTGQPGRDLVQITVAVEVDPAGRAVIESLRVTGRGAAENRTVIERWMRSLIFRPAQRDGRAVTGVFQTRFAVRVMTRQG